MSLHNNGENNYLFVNGTEIHKFKAKDSEIVATILCLGIISKWWVVDNMKKTGLSGYVYDFIVDYDAITADDILDIHKYSLKKNGIIWNVCIYFKKMFDVTMTFFYCNSLKRVSINNQECKVRSEIININCNEP